MEKLDRESQFRCQRFFFSDPLYEVVTQLFVRSTSSIRDLSDGVIAGKILCRARGYSVSELDGYGRGWLKDDKITLMLVSLTTLHVLISKGHPQAHAMLYCVKAVTTTRSSRSIC